MCYCVDVILPNDFLRAKERWNFPIASLVAHTQRRLMAKHLLLFDMMDS